MSQQMDFRDQFPGDHVAGDPIITGFVHELNNVLMIAAGNLERTRRSSCGGRENGGLSRAAWAIDQARQLTQHMLMHAHSPPNRQPAEVGEIIRKLALPVTNIVGPKIDVNFHLAPGQMLAAIPPQQFELALLNLVRNAADAMPCGGCLTITASPAQDSLAVTVADTGHGMAPDIARRATEPFFTTKGDRGTGLGLSLVRHFVECSGGQLNIETTPGSGTRIAMILPEVRGGYDWPDWYQSRSGHASRREPDTSGQSPGASDHR